MSRRLAPSTLEEISMLGLGTKQNYARLEPNHWAAGNVTQHL